MCMVEVRVGAREASSRGEASSLRVAASRVVVAAATVG